jgi:predicted esterase
MIIGRRGHHKGRSLRMSGVPGREKVGRLVSHGLVLASGPKSRVPRSRPVLINDGEEDNRRLPDDGAHLATRLRDAGTMVIHHVLLVGHSITSMDRRIARQ